jgi:thymidylate synthase (FAD)
LISGPPARTLECMRPTRASAPRLDEILGDSFKVLDDGFVRVVDYLGNDDAIVQAARISYGEGTKSASDDRALIRYLMRHLHTTPFEMCELKLHVRVPMDAWRQWIRHRTASVNEYSTRYSVAIDAAQRTAPEDWREQSQSNRQGSGTAIAAAVGAELSAEESELHQRARAVYERRIALGVSREQARKDLPLATYTEAYWKIDLHNLFHFLALRMDSHAQFEIRAYAVVVGEQLVSRWCPLAWEAFCDYRLGAVVLSRAQRELISAIIAGDLERARNVALDSGLARQREEGLVATREGREVDPHLASCGLRAPWH